MKKRIYTSVAIVITLVLLFLLKIYVSDYFFDAFFGIIACFGAFEMSILLTKMGKFNFQWVIVFFPTLLVAGNLIGIHYLTSTGDLFWLLYTILIDVGLMLLVTLGLFLFGLFAKRITLNEIGVRGLKMSIKNFAFKKALHTLVAFMYPSFMFLFFLFLNHFNDMPLAKLDDMTSNISVFVVITALIVPIFTDTFAMLCGNLIGGKKLCPKISPNKTISGAIGGLVWCVLLSACVYLVVGCIESFAPLMEALPIWMYLIIVALGSCVAQFSDVFESFIKRRAGVKDSGNLLPGHGGMLDRTDSYMFIAPYITLAFWIFAL